MKKKFLLMMLVSVCCLNLQGADKAEPAAKRQCMEQQKNNGGDSSGNNGGDSSGLMLLASAASSAMSVAAPAASPAMPVVVPTAAAAALGVQSQSQIAAPAPFSVRPVFLLVGPFFNPFRQSQIAAAAPTAAPAPTVAPAPIAAAAAPIAVAPASLGAQPRPAADDNTVTVCFKKLECGCLIGISLHKKILNEANSIMQRAETLHKNKCKNCNLNLKPECYTKKFKKDNFVCSDCPFRTATVSGLVQHYNRSHTPKSPIESASAASPAMSVAAPAAASREDNYDSDSSDDTMTPDELKKELSKIRGVRAARSGNAAAPAAASLGAQPLSVADDAAAAMSVDSGSDLSSETRVADKVFFQKLSCGHCITVTCEKNGDGTYKDIASWSVTRSITEHKKNKKDKCFNVSKQEQGYYIELYKKSNGDLQCPFSRFCQKGIASSTEVARHYNKHHYIAPATVAAVAQAAPAAAAAADDDDGDDL